MITHINALIITAHQVQLSNIVGYPIPIADASSGTCVHVQHLQKPPIPYTTTMLSGHFFVSVHIIT